MEPQEIFETVVRHCFEQGRQAIDIVRNKCMYRTKDGLKCAAGCLIPSSLYDPAMENLTFFQLVKNFTMPQWFKTNVGLIDSLQLTHDKTENWKNVKTLKKAFISIGERHNLDVSFIDNLVLNKVKYYD